MHKTRVVILIGILLTVVSLFMKPVGFSLPDVPEGLPADAAAGIELALSGAEDQGAELVPTQFGALEAWEKIVVIVLIVAMLGLALTPDTSRSLNGPLAGVAVALGAVGVVIGVIKLLDAFSASDDLKAGLNQGLAPINSLIAPLSLGEASAGPAVGIWVLLAGVLIAFAGAIWSMRVQD